MERGKQLLHDTSVVESPTTLVGISLFNVALPELHYFSRTSQDRYCNRCRQRNQYPANFATGKLRSLAPISNWETNRSFVYAIEAARNLCAGKEGAERALRLLKMAVKDVTEALKIMESNGL